MSAGQDALISAGVDEAGRGCLAGPVVAAAAIIPPDVHIAGLNDSKALTATKRAKLFSEITNKAIWAYATATVEEITQHNIRGATLLAMRRATLALRTKPDTVFIDGRDTIGTPFSETAVIGGDAIMTEIMAASIIAKHIRDEMMKVYECRYPQYGFAKHKGYGTAAHIHALETYGLVKGCHRVTFKPCCEYV